MLILLGPRWTRRLGAYPAAARRRPPPLLVRGKCLRASSSYTCRTWASLGSLARPSISTTTTSAPPPRYALQDEMRAVHKPTYTVQQQYYLDWVRSRFIQPSPLDCTIAADTLASRHLSSTLPLRLLRSEPAALVQHASPSLALHRPHPPRTHSRGVQPRFPRVRPLVHQPVALAAPPTDGADGPPGARVPPVRHARVLAKDGVPAESDCGLVRDGECEPARRRGAVRTAQLSNRGAWRFVLPLLRKRVLS